MKRFVFLVLLLALLLCFQSVTFSQQGRLTYPEQEQALNLAHQIATQKSVSVEGSLDEVSVDVSDLIDQGYEAWANLEFDKALEYFRSALNLEPHNTGIGNLIYELERAKITFRRCQLEIEREILEDKRRLQTDEAWLIDEPESVIEPTKIRKVSLNKLRDIASKKKVSVDFVDAQIRKVLSYLSKVSGINIIMDEAAVNRAGSISIHLKDVTLIQALESVLRTKGLGYRFEDDFIWVSTKSSFAKEELITRIYYLSQGLATFTTFTTFDTVTVDNLVADIKYSEKKGDEKQEENTSLDASLGMDTYEGVKVGGPGGVSGKITMTIKDVLRQIIEWPQGSSIFLDNRTSTLIVRNTPSNLAILEQALEVLDVNPPQVMIEARFVEIGDDDLSSLGFKLSAEVSATGAREDHSYPFNKNQDTKYAGPFSSASNTGFGVLDFQQFQAVLSAIEQNTNSNTLSSPKITTISGQEAIIKIVKEYRYPTKYELQTFTTVDTSGLEKTEAFPVPADFKTRDIGIILKVTPNVGSDGKTINLTLVPEVSEFDIEKDMFNYGTTENPYLQPFFNVRNATASIVVNNNDTVVMGGLMREVVEHTVDKIPLLGNIPVLGRLFTRKYDNKQKRNLLIFVTARIIAPTGQTVEN